MLVYFNVSMLVLNVVKSVIHIMLIKYFHFSSHGSFGRYSTFSYPLTSSPSSSSCAACHVTISHFGDVNFCVCLLARIIFTSFVRKYEMFNFYFVFFSPFFSMLCFNFSFRDLMIAIIFTKFTRESSK